MYLEGNIFWRFDLTCGKELLFCLCNKYLCLFHCQLCKKENFTQVSVPSLKYSPFKQRSNIVDFTQLLYSVSDHFFSKILVHLAEFYLGWVKLKKTASQQCPSLMWSGLGVLQGGPGIYSSLVRGQTIFLVLLNIYVVSKGFAHNPSLPKLGVGQVSTLYARLIGCISTSLTGTFPTLIYCWWVQTLIIMYIHYTDLSLFIWTVIRQGSHTECVYVPLHCLFQAEIRIDLCSSQYKCQGFFTSVFGYIWRWRKLSCLSRIVVRYKDSEELLSAWIIHVSKSALWKRYITSGIWNR